MKRKLALLCVVLALALAPLSAFASLDDWDGVDGDDYGSVEYGDDFADDTDDPEPEPEPETSISAQDKYQPEINNKNDKIKDLEAEEDMIQGNISNAKTAKEREQANKSYIDQQIYITKSKIELLLEKIDLLENQIEEKEEEIRIKQMEYDESYELFLSRLRSLYMSDDATMLGLVLGAEDFADYLTKSETVNRIANHDAALMDSLVLERIALEGEREALEQDKLDLEDDRVAVEGEKDLLARQQQEALLKLQDIEELERQFRADLAKNQALQAEMAAELDRIYQMIIWDSNPYVGGEMAWPLPGYYNITSPYGWRFGGSDFHTGMDISGSGVHGSPIVAANDGTVKYANWSYSPGRGYGIYLIIDHGGGTSTLYGHCSSLAVGEGDVVKRGQTIAYVGSTGWSTGPHLHFEVRENGSHVNPASYVGA